MWFEGLVKFDISSTFHNHPYQVYNTPDYLSILLDNTFILFATTTNQPNNSTKLSRECDFTFPHP